MLIRAENIGYEKVKKPTYKFNPHPVDLTDATMAERCQKVLKKLEEEQLDLMAIYADREHGANFSYLTGFEPRFEEAMLVVHRDGTAFLLLGNESMKMEKYSRIKAKAIHTPYFSLPNQPMEGERDLKEVLEQTGVTSGKKVGVVGWKMFTSRTEDNTQLFDVPYFIVQKLKEAVGSEGKVSNRADLFISPEYGVRIRMNANEIAHYEFRAMLASDCVLETMEQIEPGISEMELANSLQKYGQPISVQTICAAGERFTNAVVEPRAKKLALGEAFSSTVGYKGGLTSRSGYVAAEKEELPEGQKDYLDRAAKPYYAATATWYSTIRIGLTGGELYDAVKTVFPRETYGWMLNPGHLTATEEWMSSPISEGSKIPFQSGMLLQMDIVMGVKGYAGANAEDGIALADQALRKELEEQYPDVWKRMQRRRTYMIKELGMELSEEVLPLSDSEGYFRPYLLNREKALKVIRKGVN